MKIIGPGPVFVFDRFIITSTGVSQKAKIKSSIKTSFQEIMILHPDLISHHSVDSIIPQDKKI